MGLTTAKAIALVAEKPLIGINHLEAHALTARLLNVTTWLVDENARLSALVDGEAAEAEIGGLRGVS